MSTDTIIVVGQGSLPSNRASALKVFTTIGVNERGPRSWCPPTCSAGQLEEVLLRIASSTSKSAQQRLLSFAMTPGFLD
jgi:hypothetical protein